MTSQQLHIDIEHELDYINAEDANSFYERSIKAWHQCSRDIETGVTKVKYSPNFQIETSNLVVSIHASQELFQSKQTSSSNVANAKLIFII